MDRKSSGKCGQPHYGQKYPEELRHQCTKSAHLAARPPAFFVRSARTTLAKAGKFIGPQAPYGYKRSESDKQKLVIDEEPAELLSKMERFDLELIRQVVKRITMYDDGNIQFEWNVDDFIQVK